MSISHSGIRRVNGGNQNESRHSDRTSPTWIDVRSPPLTGVSGAFLGALTTSHYVYLVCAVQLLGGLLLLAGQFLPLGLALLAPVIANIVTYHLTMDRGGAQLAILATILWAFLAWKFRAYFAPLFTRNAVWTAD
jgi:putative oxidoreductase